MPNDIDVKCILIPKVVAPEKKMRKGKDWEIFQGQKETIEGKKFRIAKKRCCSKKGVNVHRSKSEKVEKKKGGQRLDEL